MTKQITPDQYAFMDVVCLAHDDMRPLYPDMLGIVVMIVLSDGPELAVQLGATVPPEVVEVAMRRLMSSCSHDQHDAFTEIPKRKPRKVV
jgi:hypothetical protein